MPLQARLVFYVLSAIFCAILAAMLASPGPKDFSFIWLLFWVGSLANSLLNGKLARQWLFGLGAGLGSISLALFAVTIIVNIMAFLDSRKFNHLVDGFFTLKAAYYEVVFSAICLWTAWVMSRKNVATYLDKDRPPFHKRIKNLRLRVEHLLAAMMIVGVTASAVSFALQREPIPAEILSSNITVTRLDEEEITTESLVVLSYKVEFPTKDQAVVKSLVISPEHYQLISVEEIESHIDTLLRSSKFAEVFSPKDKLRLEIGDPPHTVPLLESKGNVLKYLKACPPSYSIHDYRKYINDAKAAGQDEHD